MVIKWIKAIFTEPLLILKSIYFRIKNINEYLAIKRLLICNKCSEKVDTRFGEVCGKCGCILKNKTRIKDAKCDLCKW